MKKKGTSAIMSLLRSLGEGARVFIDYKPREGFKAVKSHMLAEKSADFLRERVSQCTDDKTKAAVLRNNIIKLLDGYQGKYKDVAEQTVKAATQPNTGKNEIEKLVELVNKLKENLNSFSVEHRKSLKPSGGFSNLLKGINEVFKENNMLMQKPEKSQIEAKTEGPLEWHNVHNGVSRAINDARRAEMEKKQTNS